MKTAGSKVFGIAEGLLNSERSSGALKILELDLAILLPGGTSLDSTVTLVSLRYLICETGGERK